MKQNLVTVVLTTYNGERYLTEQLDSIVTQTHENTEIIICDDASEDRTIEIIKKYEKNDSRIKTIFNKSNIGLHANLSKGLKISTGAFIAISDQDDIWEKNKIEILLNFIGAKSGVYSNSLIIDQNGKSLKTSLLDCLKIKSPTQHSSLAGLLTKNCVSGHALLFKKELLDLILPLREEILFDYQIALAASLLDGLSFCENLLTRHRIHGENNNNSSLSSKANRTVRRQYKKQENHQQKSSRRFVKLIKFKSKIGLIIKISRQIQSKQDMQIKLSSDVLDDFKKIYSFLNYESNTIFHWRLFLSMLQLRCKHSEYSSYLTIRRCFALSKNFQSLP